MRENHNGTIFLQNNKRRWFNTSSGVTSYGALGHVPPSTSNNFIFSSFWSKYDSQLSKYCVVCEISWCRCQQLTALSISTALVTKLLVIEQLLHPALKFAASVPWPNLQLCPSSQQILVTPLNTRTGHWTATELRERKSKVYSFYCGVVVCTVCSLCQTLSWLCNSSSGDLCLQPRVRKHDASRSKAFAEVGGVVEGLRSHHKNVDVNVSISDPTALPLIARR